MRKFLTLVLSLAVGAVIADDKNTYTFTEPSSTATFYWDGLNDSGKTVTGVGWSGGDPNDAYYPQPKEGADFVMDDSARGYNKTFSLYTFGKASSSKYYPHNFHSIRQISTLGDKYLGAYINLIGKGMTTDTHTVSAGGMWFYYMPTFYNMVLSLPVSQSLTVVSTNTVDTRHSFRATLAVPETTTWTTAGKFRLDFTEGSSEFAGSLVANNAFMFTGTAHHQRLACKKITLSSEAIDGIPGWPQLNWNFEKEDGTTVITTPIELNLRRLGTIHYSMNGSSKLMAIPWLAMSTTDADRDISVRFEAPVTGVVSNRCLLLGQATGNASDMVTRISYAGLARSDQQRMVFAADNSGLIPIGDVNADVWVPGVVRYTDPGHTVYINTIVSLAHQNAFGANNRDFNFEFRYGGDRVFADGTLWSNNVGTDGYKERVIMGLVATNGVDVGAGFYVEGNMQSGGSDLYGRGCTILLGSDGPGESVFSGVIKNAGPYSTTGYTANPELRFQGGRGGSAVFGGQITSYAAKVVIGEGDVVFTNQLNTFSSDPHGMRVRSGRLLITHPKAIYHKSANQEVLLGDWVPTTCVVRVYHSGIWSKADVDSVHTTDSTRQYPKYYSSDSAHTNNMLEFVTMPVIDGVVLEKGDRVLQSAILGATYGQSINDPSPDYKTGVSWDQALVLKTNATTMATVNGWVTNQAPHSGRINGLWEVVSTTEDGGANRWRRLDFLDEDSEACKGNGIRVHVTDGKKFAGRTFYLANHEDWTIEQNGTPLRTDCGFHFGPTWFFNGSKTTTSGQCGWYAFKNAWLLFHDEPSFNPNVSFLLKGAFDYGSKVVVTDNKSSGDSEIGGDGVGVTNLFTGVVLVEKPTVCLAASTNSLAMFTTLSNAVGVATTIVKTGAGTVALTNETLNLTMDGGLTLRAGTLVVTTNFFANKGTDTDHPLAYELVNGSSGTLEVAAGTNEVDLAGRTIDLKNFETQKEDTEIVLLKTSGGPLVGEPTVTGLGETTYWRIHIKNNDKKNEHALIASYVKRGTFIIIR